MIQHYSTTSSTYFYNLIRSIFNILGNIFCLIKVCQADLKAVLTSKHIIGLNLTKQLFCLAKALNILMQYPSSFQVNSHITDLSLRQLICFH